MKATQTTLTPALAKKLLDNNPSNRRLSESRARNLADAILRGEWKLNGESIIVGENGDLLDGQHRCRAVVLADISVPVILVEGVKNDAFTTIDIGEKRSVGQIFEMQGFASGNNLSAAISVLEMYLGNRTTRRNLTFAQRAEVLRENPEIVQSVAVTNSMRQIPSSVAAVAHFAAEKAYGKAFADQWIANFKQAVFDDPSRTLSLLLERSSTGRRGFADAYWVLVVTLKAISASANGTSPKRINAICSETYPTL